MTSDPMNQPNDPSAHPAEPPSPGETSKQSVDQGEHERSDAMREPVVRAENSLVRGTLVVHYVTRDVQLDVDGDVAMQAFEAWQLRGQRGLTVDARHAQASLVHVGIDVAEVYGLTWMPNSILGAGVGRDAL
jgi:hypothetical protein